MVIEAFTSVLNSRTNAIELSQGTTNLKPSHHEEMMTWVSRLQRDFGRSFLYENYHAYGMCFGRKTYNYYN